MGFSYLNFIPNITEHHFGKFLVFNENQDCSISRMFPGGIKKIIFEK